MKDKIVSEFRKAAGLLGRHSGFASSYRATENGRRIVEIVEMAERGPDAGCNKQLFSVLFATPLARMALGSCLAIGAVYFFRGMAGYRGFEGISSFDLAVAVLLAAFSTALARLFADRFRRERDDLEDVFGHVLLFKDHALALACILGCEEGTAKDVIDRRFVRRAMKIVAAESESAQSKAPLSKEIEEERALLYSEFSIARKFGLGKRLQGYFDRAKIEVNNLARRSEVPNN